MRFGVFLTPNHSPADDPTLALERDLWIVEQLEALGYAEAWFGEHHGSGWQFIASPEAFIAAASQRTSRIRLATGVAGLAFQHPLLLADRMVLIDHLSRGRVILGTGPGGPQWDAPMLGIDTGILKQRHAEALEAIMTLLECDEPIDRQTDWFTLHRARLQLRPYRRPRFEVVVSSLASDSGPTLAGQHGLGMLSLGMLPANGRNRLADSWALADATARDSGKTIDRDGWRIAGPRMHLAYSDAEARREVAFGIRQWVAFGEAAGARVADSTAHIDSIVDALNASGTVIIGTPDRAVAHLEKLVAASGGFGCYIIPSQEWADRTATIRSYDLFARFVAPRFTGSTASLTRAASDFIDVVSKNPNAALLARGGKTVETG